MGRTLSWVARIWVAVFVVVALVQVGAEWVGAEGVAQVTQWALMPVLAGALVAATRWPRGHLVTWTLVALGFSWLGDLVPSFVADDAAFLVMVGFFLLAQVAFVVAFAPDARRSVLHRRPVLLLPYAAVLVGMVGVCANGAGSLAIPVAVYGGCLTAMAVLSTGVGRMAGVGGAVFLISDGLIALDEFVPSFHLPQHDFWVMVTYVAAQALIAAAVVLRNMQQRRAPEPTARPVVSRHAMPDNVVLMVRAARTLSRPRVPVR
ncbi:lysoplasmalogenase [Cellulomonas sp. URHD0024]|uniref:lysoplasmalogenase n=1 Tax=Cellulomonas sp. URHD0024 TaxID=1302620 RepID=UPI00042454FB|nr:lysoplasmalogenase [Cellulomonas sp. URHD0024]